MKKLTILTLLMLSMGVVLTGCTNDTDSVDTTDVVVADVEESVLDIEDGEEIEDRDEYKFEVTINGADGFEMISKIYKKWNNSMTEVIKMVSNDIEEMPFNIKKMLKIDGNTYQQVEKDGDTFWFSIPGMDAEDDMFNLREMSQIDKSFVVDTKFEKINGDKMTCYYIEDTIEWAGKTCLDGDVFAYGEYSEDGITDTIVIDDFDDDVRNSVFDIPDEDEILSTQEMMQLFQ